MKSESICLFVLVLTTLVPSHADTFDVTASCDTSAGFYVCSEPFSLNAVVTTQEFTGTFFWTAFESDITGTISVVTGGSGTFNGVPFSFTHTADPSTDNWLVPLQNVCIGPVCFFQVFDDTFTVGGVNGFEQVFVNAQQVVPEPPLFWLLLTALSLLGLSRRAQMSLRRLSGR